jgi:hypothetical protein
MGCYNTIFFNCPDCGNKLEVQSKSGDCSLSDYEFEDAPLRDLTDIENEIVTCYKCNRTYKIKLQKIVNLQLKRITEEDK